MKEDPKEEKTEKTQEIIARVLPLQEEFLSSFSMSLRSMRLSSTAKTWGCSPFSITHLAEEEEEEAAEVASISLPNNNA
jgi:hypothetical protein